LAVDDWQLAVDDYIVPESNHLCLTSIGSISEVIYVRA
jgi:hypothetical protein